MIKFVRLLLIPIILLLNIYTATSETDYCKVQKCSNPSRHVMCLYPNKTTGASCDTVIRSGLTYLEVMIIRNVIDEEGSSYKHLAWDAELATLAQKWAHQCPDHKDECRSLDKLKTVVHQNIGKRSFNSGLPGSSTYKAYDPNLLAEIVKEWYQKRHTSSISNTNLESYNVFGCGLTKTSRCDFISYRLPTCGDHYTVYLVCNFASK